MAMTSTNSHEFHDCHDVTKNQQNQHLILDSQPHFENAVIFDLGLMLDEINVGFLSVYNFF